jgi:hypothetical protein
MEARMTDPIRATLDRPAYRAGEVMTLTVDVTPPADSTLAVPAVLDLAGRRIEEEVLVPAWRLRLVDEHTAWTRSTADAGRVVFTAPAAAGTVTARLEWLGAAAEAVAQYVLRRAMLTGWCAGVRGGEGEAAAMRRQVKMYPGTDVVRSFFESGQGLPASAWTDPNTDLANSPVDADVIVSWKDPVVDAAAFVAAWEATNRTGRLILVPHHEPEQGSGGDPTVAVFRASWTWLREQVGEHPARRAGRLLLAVCYTLVWVRRVDPATGRRVNDWRTWWPDHEATAVDLVLGDWYVYDPASKTPWKPGRYEPAATALAIMLEISTATGKPWGLGEINHERIASDATGQACAAWYRATHAWAAAHGCSVWCHFHRGGGDLTNRGPEQQALRELIAG